MNSTSISQLNQCEWINYQEFKNFVEIGKGSFSKVFSFSDPTDGKTKALKVMAVEPGEDTFAFKERCDKEIFVMRKLSNCPQIMSYEEYYFDLKNNLFFIVMKKSEMSLSKLVSKNGGKLGEKILLTLTETIMKALLYAHNLNLVHRDLKPSNILYTSPETFLIGDWGVARKMNRFGTQSHAFTIMGTDAYLPPEIFNPAKGKELKLNLFKADIYSFGLIILFCCGLPEINLEKGLDKCDEDFHSQQIQNYIKKYVSKDYPLYTELILQMCAFKQDDRCDIFQFEKLFLGLSQPGRDLIMKPGEANKGSALEQNLKQIQATFEAAFVDKKLETELLKIGKVRDSLQKMKDSKIKTLNLDLCFSEEINDEALLLICKRLQELRDLKEFTINLE